MVYFVSGIGDYWLSDDQKVMLFNEGFKALNDVKIHLVLKSLLHVKTFRI